MKGKKHNKQNVEQLMVNNLKQAGAELGQAQLKLEL